MEEVYIVFILAWLLGSFISGLTSFGSAMIAMPITAFYLPPKILLPISILLVIATSCTRIITYHAHLNYKALIPLTLAAIPGSIVGGYVLLFISATSIQLLAGAVLIFYFILQIIPKKEIPHDDNAYTASLAGFVSGFTNTSISLSSPPLVMYAIYSGWSKECFFSTMSFSVFLNCIIAAIVHASSGLYTKELLPYLYYGIPTVIVGLALSHPVSKRVNVRTFKRIILFAVGFSGVICVYKALSSLYFAS